MKIKIIAGTMVALSFSLMSCSDFLTEDPRGKLTPENFFSTQDELNGVRADRQGDGCRRRYRESGDVHPAR